MDQSKKLLAALEAPPRVAREVLLRRLVEVWFAQQRAEYQGGTQGD